jgi:uncharacterized protein (DUF4415 family)
LKGYGRATDAQIPELGGIAVSKNPKKWYTTYYIRDIMGMVSYTFETLPPVSKEDWERIDAVKDEDIDYSDIPEMKDLSGLRPRQVRELKKPEKVPVSCNLDADIVEWLKQDGDGYQTRLNSILRQAMAHAQ